MRLFGALLIMGASVMIGAMVADNYRQRPRLLIRLAQAVDMLRSQIGFGLVPLPRAFSNVAGMFDGPVAALFSEVSARMQSGQGYTGGEAWQLALLKTRTMLPFDRDDLVLLEDVGRPLGLSDKADQERHLLLAAENLRTRAARIETAAIRGARIWFYLGISGGAILVLLLL